MEALGRWYDASSMTFMAGREVDEEISCGTPNCNAKCGGEVSFAVGVKPIDSCDDEDNVD